MSAPERDRWGRPLIVPPAGGDRIAYTRVSTLAKTLDDETALTAWKGRLTAVGLARAPELADRVASLVNLYDDPVSAAKRDLNDIVSDAATVAGASRAATIGTSLHELTQAIDTGRDLTVIPDRWARHLDTYRAATAGIDVLDTEVFVANDPLRAAGTFDRLVRLPDGRVVVADLKTGKSDPDFPLKVATQVAVYAAGMRYDADTGERAPIHPDLDSTVGLLIHLPANADPPRCDLYALELDTGYSAAVLATEVRAVRKLKAPNIAAPFTAEGVTVRG